MGRFSLGSSLWFVAFVALGFAAVRNASQFWVGATFLATFGLLCTSALGAVLARPPGRAWWLGFALFGWGYLAADLVPEHREAARLPSLTLAREIFRASNPLPSARTGLNAPVPTIGLDGRPVRAPMGTGKVAGLNFQEYTARYEFNVGRIGHWLFVLLFARAGATVSCLFTKDLPWRRRPAHDPVPAPVP
jgi:hypothetical protein